MEVSRTGYLTVLIIFLIAVASGVSVVLEEFNRMVYPAGPVRPFNFNENGPGAWEVEFLGEKVRVELPDSPVPDVLAGDLVQEGRRYLSLVFQNTKNRGEGILRDLLAGVQDTAGDLAPGLYGRTLELLERLPLPERLRYFINEDSKIIDTPGGR